MASATLQHRCPNPNCDKPFADHDSVCTHLNTSQYCSQWVEEYISHMLQSLADGDESDVDDDDYECEIFLVLCGTVAD